MGISEEGIRLENRRKYKNEKMMSYDWYCDICKNGKSYTLRGNCMHLIKGSCEQLMDECYLLLLF